MSPMSDGGPAKGHINPRPEVDWGEAKFGLMEPRPTVRQAYKMIAAQLLPRLMNELANLNFDYMAKLTGQYADAQLTEDKEHAKWEAKWKAEREKAREGRDEENLRLCERAGKCHAPR